MPMKKALSVLVLMLVLTVSQSCASKDDSANIYKIGRTWEFKVLFLNKSGSLYDSCKLLLEPKKADFIALLNGQNSIRYIYKGCCGQNVEESTGVEEKDKHVFIHPPR